MTLTTLRKQCEARLRDLPIPIPFDIQTFADAIAARRGRPIEICVWQIPDPTLSGICFSLPTTDIIFVKQTTPLHQQHVILHELFHLFCGHEGHAGEEIQTLLLPDITVKLSGLRRDTYANADEREAEMLASLVLTRVHRTQAHMPAPDLRTTDVLRLLDSLEGMTYE